MKAIGLYKELVMCDDIDLPSIYDYINSESYEGKETIVAYLKNGTVDCAASGRAKDCFTGEIINEELLGMNDGEYTWQSDLAYYVEKYNLKLDNEFEQHVLQN